MLAAIKSGGFWGFKGHSSKFGQHDPMELAPAVVGEEMVEKLEAILEIVESKLKVATRQALAEKQEWVVKADDGSGNVNNIPVFAFVKASMITAIERVRPMLIARGGLVETRANEITLESAARCTDVRRCLSQLLQEEALLKAKEEVFPDFDEPLQALELPPAVEPAVRQQALDLAEEDLRQAVHSTTVHWYTETLALMSVDDAMSLEEAHTIVNGHQADGPELEEDEFGFCSRSGGFRGYRDNGDHHTATLDAAELMETNKVDPMGQVNLVLQPLLSQLKMPDLASKVKTKGVSGDIIRALQSMMAKSEAAYAEWTKDPK